MQFATKKSTVSMTLSSDVKNMHVDQEAENFQVVMDDVCLSYSFCHVRLIFFCNEERKIAPFSIIPPDYICYNERLCSDFLPATVFLKNGTCCYPSELRLHQLKSYDILF